MTMAWVKDNTAAQQAVSLNDLRTLVADRLQTAQRRLDPASATAAFAQASQSQHDAMVGSLIFGMLCWGPIMEMFAGQLDGGLAATVSSPAVGAVVDGASMVWDEKAYKNRHRGLLAIAFKDGVYHGGRKQAKILDRAQVKKDFNLTAANENNQYVFDAEAEIAGMAEMLDIIDHLEQRGATAVALEQGQPISHTLRAAVATKVQGDKPAVFGRSLRLAA